MKSRGFTLVELLSVIILLSLLMILVLPKMLGSVEESITDTDNLTKELIYDAAKQYIENNKQDFEKQEGNRYCVSLSSLVNERYLKSPIKLNGKDEDITHLKSVEILYIDGFKYTLKDNEECTDTNIICRAVQTKTTGNIPARDTNGNLLFNVGDEFVCEVKPGISYIFFVLSKQEDSINLIMNRNINITGGVATLDNPSLVSWNSTGSNSDGPIDAMNYLHNATKNWENIPNIVMDYTDEGKKYGKIKTIEKAEEMITTITTIDEEELVTYVNLKARIPSYLEVALIDKNDNWLYDYLSSGGPSDNNQVINTIFGYWLLDSDKNLDDCSCFSAYNGEVYCQRINVDVLNNTENGIRPVITINKYDFY